MLQIGIVVGIAIMLYVASKAVTEDDKALGANGCLTAASVLFVLFVVAVSLYIWTMTR